MDDLSKKNINNTTNKSVKLNMLMSTILTVSNFVFPLITYAYVARILLTSGIGKISFVQSILGYAGYIATLGIQGYAMRESAKCRNDKDRLSKLVHEIVMINFLSTILAYFVLFVAVICVKKLHDYSSLFLVMSWTILLETLGVEWLYKALEKYTYITIRSIIVKIISVILIFVFVKTKDDVLIYGALCIFGTTASNILNFISARKYIYLKRYHNYNLKAHIKPIMVFFMSTIIISIYGHIDTVMIGFLKGDEECGLYNSALKIKTAILSFSTAITSVLIPRLSYYIGEKNQRKFNELIIKSTKVSLALMLPLSVFVFIFSKEVLLFLCGNEFLPAIPTVRVLSICVIVLSITNLLGNQILIPKGMEKQFSKTVFWGMWINLLVNSLLIPFFGSLGAAIATLGTESFNALYMALACKSETKTIKENIKFSKYLMPLLLVAVLGFVFRNYIMIDSVIIKLSISTILYFGIYFTILLIEKEEIVTLGLSSVVRLFKKPFNKP